MPSHLSYRPARESRTVALNKPYGVLSQFTPEPGSSHQTLAGFGIPPDLYPVGRLDADSEGLLILSSDPGLNAALLHPRRGHGRTYLAQVERVPTPEALAQLRHGVVIDGRPTLPARAELLEGDPGLPARPVPIRERRSIPTAWIALTITEGRNRQVRRMTAAVGHPTLRLVRAAIGRLDLDWETLPPGTWRDLSPHEVSQLFDDPDSSTR